MKSFTLILIGFFITACTDVQPGTYDGPGTEIRGKILDSSTMKPIKDVSINVSRATISKTGDFQIPRYTQLPITTLKDGPWGSHRYFIVSKKGYTPMFCVCDMRNKSAFAVIMLSPEGKKVERTYKGVGPNVSCIPYIDQKNQKDNL